MIRRNIARMLRPRVNWVEKLVIDDFAAESDPALGPIKFNDHNLFKIASQIVSTMIFRGSSQLTCGGKGGGNNYKERGFAASMNKCLFPINTRPRIYLYFDEIKRIVNVSNMFSFPLFDEKLKCVTFINLNSPSHLCYGNKLWK